MSNGAAASGTAPRFPSYLLPSFSLPFKRRQISPASSCPSTPPPTKNSVPPLSSSPTESALSSSAGSSCNTSSYTPSRLSFTSSAEDYVQSLEEQPPGNSRLLRVLPDTIRCSTCSTDLAFASQIVSKGFTGRYGRAYLVSPPENDGSQGGKRSGNLMNIKVGKEETRLLVTGSHIVADIMCKICQHKVGWKYVDAKEESQRYKVGKYILETRRTVDYRHWEDAVISEIPEFGTAAQQAKPAKPALDAEPVVFDSGDEDECEDLFSGTWDPAVVAKRRSLKAMVHSYC